MTEFQKWNSSLRKGGFEVITTKVAQEQVANFVNENNVDVVLVRSATKVRKDIIDACPGLKIIGRGGVGMDNIDVDYAKSKGITVINTCFIIRISSRISFCPFIFWRAFLA
jgi:D-3-phosphoglycerate dehydrogenase